MPTWDFEALTFYGNAILDWLLAIGVAALVFVGLLALRGLAVRRLRRGAEASRTRLGTALEVAAGLVRRIAWPFLAVIALYAGAYYLDLPDKAVGVLSAALVVVVFFQFGLIGTYALITWAEGYERAKDDPTLKTTFGAVRFLGQLAIWSFALLLALDNLGVDITALVAGLGIGGIAVAFALQSILNDLFASVSIILDKPFEAGDFIIVGDLLGTVERIGVKTTRLRSLSGEQIVLSNNDLLQSRIRNYKRMNERRVVFSVGVTYETPAEKLAAIPAMLREAVEAQPFTRFDRAHFKQFGDFALVFEIVYYMLMPDYNLMMDAQQAINLTIFGRFAEEGIEFAYPTQTIHLRPVAGEAPSGIVT
ncbi:MAG: mechanosensitive ion channel family protein [Kiloniellaceae bacterium]